MNSVIVAIAHLFFIQSSKVLILENKAQYGFWLFAVTIQRVSCNRKRCHINILPGYKPALDPGISHAFQSAAIRWGQTLVPPGVYRRGGYEGVPAR